MTTNQSSLYQEIHHEENVKTLSRNNGINYVIRHANNTCCINFAHGTVTEFFPNGILNESLIAILIDRLTILDQIKHSTHNIDAIVHLTKAAEALHLRKLSVQNESTT